MRGRGDEPGDRLRSTPSLRRVHGSLLIRLADLHRQHPVDEIARRFRPGREALHQVFVGVEVPAEVVGVCRRLERDAGGRKRLHRLAPHVQEVEQLPRRTMRLRKLRIGQDSAQDLASPLERLRISVAVRTAHRAPANRRARRQVAAPRPPRRRGIASDGTECGLGFSQLTGIETCRGDLIIAVGSRDRGSVRAERSRDCGRLVRRSAAVRKHLILGAHPVEEPRIGHPERRSSSLECLCCRKQGRVAAVHDVAVCRKESLLRHVRRGDLENSAPCRVPGLQRGDHAGPTEVGPYCSHAVQHRLLFGGQRPPIQDTPRGQ